MTLMGTWAIGLLEGQLGWQGGKDFDFFSFPVISPGMPMIPLGPIDAIAIPKDGNVDAAKEALIYFSEVKPQMAMSHGSGAIAPNRDVAMDFYSDIQQRIIQDIDADAPWAFNYDLATPPVVAVAGLKSFSRFLDHPEQIDAILEALEKTSRRYFETAHEK